jgi:hypothetical protein
VENRAWLCRAAVGLALESTTQDGGSLLKLRPVVLLLHSILCIICMWLIIIIIEYMYIYSI